MPEIIQFKDGHQIINAYDASGKKLNTRYYTILMKSEVPVVSTLQPGQVLNLQYNMDIIDETGTFYVDNIEYGFNGCDQGLYWIDKIYNTEGYVDRVGSLGDNKYSYFRKDHLGNIREVWRPQWSYGGSTVYQATTSQRTQYYPSGLPLESYTGDNPEEQNKKYNGKEFVEMHGYDTYDYGARGYYAAIGRCTSVDPLAEKYYSVSPYAYCLNNPVNFIDPDGKKVVIVGTAEYRKQVMNDLKQLAKDNSDIGKMVNDLIKSPNTHILEMPKGNDGYNYTMYNDKEAKDGTPQGSKVGYDPNNKETKSGYKRTPRVGLAHELQHSSDVDKGKMDTETKTETGVPVKEVDAVNTENKIREKTGDEKRTTYGGKKISKVWLDN